MYRQVQMRQRLSEADMARGVGMLQSGSSQRQVAGALGVSQSVVSRLWNRYQTTGTVTPQHSGGVPRATSQREDRYLVVQARRNPFRNATQLQNDLHNASNNRISTQTVRRRLPEAGLHSRAPLICVPLTRNHEQVRLQWAMEHQGWTAANWTPVLFSDESRFCLDMTDRRRRVWRRLHERYYPNFIAQHDRYGGGSVLVWGGISMQGKTDLLVMENGTMNAVRYRDEVLHPIVRPYAGAIGPNFVFMDDNARPHRARIVNQYLEDEGILRMEWPARSPDLNPIEHVWDIIGRAIQARQQQPRTVHELGMALQEEWDRVPQQQVRNLICSMRRRCRAVIGARGGHTHY